jgi:hypothetical protein
MCDSDRRALQIVSILQENRRQLLERQQQEF